MSQDGVKNEKNYKTMPAQPKYQPTGKYNTSKDLFIWKCTIYKVFKRSIYDDFMLGVC